MRKDIDEKIHRLPFSYYDTTTNGEVLSRLTNDVDSIHQCFSQSITQIITAITTLVGVLVMMLSINVPMTFIAMAWLIVSVTVVGFIVKRSQKHFMTQQDYSGHVNGQVEEIYGCHNIVSA